MPKESAENVLDLIGNGAMRRWTEYWWGSVRRRRSWSDDDTGFWIDHSGLINFAGRHRHGFFPVC